MAEEIIIDCKFLTHTGGTKFYEVIQLHNVAARRFVLVKRWGKKGVMESGGETKVEVFTDVRKCQHAAHKILEEKRKGKPGQGSYENFLAHFGLHGRAGTLTHGRAFEAIRDHYGVQAAEHLSHELMLGAYAVEPEQAPEVVFEKPAVPIDRGDTWGSW